MYHAHFRGTHYEMGFRFGSSLVKNNRFVLDNVPFPITAERKEFACACVPLYREYFPEILEEISGLADGQQCGVELIQAVLFSMYAIPPSCCCSCFAISDGSHILLGRNSDFIPALEKLNMNVIYRFSPNGSHSFTGNTTAFIEMEDGVNCRGLAAGLTSVYPAVRKPGLNAGMLLRFFLEKCENTEDVIRQLDRLPVSSSQTFTVADSKGETAVIERSPQRTKVIRPSKERPFVCATNIFSSEEMSAFQKTGIDTWRAEERYETLSRSLTAHSGRMDLSAVQNLLAGKEGFLCQYDRQNGTDTVWSVVYDLSGKGIYRTEGNPGRRKFKKDERFLLN